MSFIIKLITLVTIITTAVSADYSPIEVSCPISNSMAPKGSLTNGLLRENDYISTTEYDWIKSRQLKTKDSLISFLNNLNLSDFNNVDFEDYYNDMNQSSINVALAFSGGSYRAMLTGAGELSALDSRTTPYESNANDLRGLLDSSTYISGLSGGSLLLSSLIFQNWSSVDDIITSNEIWNLTTSPYESDISFWLNLIDEITPKKNAGFNISLIDIYGRILSKVMFTNIEPNNGIDLNWSDITKLNEFKNQDMPFPIVLVTGGVYNNLSDFKDNMIEFTPFEFGSWDPEIGSFLDLKYLGTSLIDGEPIDNSSCVNKFDNAGFLIGSSSDIIASYQDYLDQPSKLSELGLNIPSNYLTIFLNLISSNHDDITYSLIPNPFYETNLVELEYETELIEQETLKLVDGGYFEEAIPLDPFLVASREIDIIISFDNSGNTNDTWPDGTSLYNTMDRLKEIDQDSNFYELPSTTEEFIELKLNEKPTFFGCNGSKLITQQDDYSYMKPILIYYPNTNITYMSNVSGSQFTFTDEDRNDMIENGYNIAINDKDDDFPKCIGCAILKRSQERMGIDEVGDECSKCFKKYCYGYDVDDVDDISEEVPTGLYDVSSTTSSSGSTAGSTSTSGSTSATSTSVSSSGSKSSASLSFNPCLNVLLLSFISIIVFI